MTPSAIDGATLVRLDSPDGLRVLDVLGPRCGGVIADPDRSALYWIVGPQDTQGWEELGASVVATEDRPTVPPPDRTKGPGPHWRMCPASDNWRTDTRALRAAIADARA